MAKASRRSGVDYAQTARRLLEEALAAAGLARGRRSAGTFSTGYGRDNVPGVAGKMTEIACHGKGAYHFFRQAMTVIDIGAQDCKLIHLDARGCRTGFKMNRKCAAGTGAFLEEIAYRLDLAPADLNGLAERSTKEAPAGELLHGVRGHGNPGEDPRGHRGGRHRQGRLPLGGQSGSGDGRCHRRAGDDRRRGGL